jgi:NADH:ubiquinone oxidoreductase subunit E
MRRTTVLVARPTPSGVDERSLAALTAAVAARASGPVRVAHLDQADPSVAAVLDEIAETAVDGDEVVLVPLALPADLYLRNWIARAAAHWRESRGATLHLLIAPSPASTEATAAAVAELAAGEATPVVVSPAAFASPAWSVREDPARHVLVCRGPRCTVYGAGATHRALAAAAKGRDVLVTPVGCLGPCNLGPLVVDYPAGVWHEAVDADRARSLLA